ncbi:hypothetical protein GCM10023314_12890 [Algibacter agarivorans]|uniref:Uncharacterized protein n=1 Tax=Algibacter agarivorans TaxID=1109741 RepID=A0ABP9GG38_9FLAO
MNKHKGNTNSPIIKPPQKSFVSLYNNARIKWVWVDLAMISSKRLINQNDPISDNVKLAYLKISLFKNFTFITF